MSTPSSARSRPARPCSAQPRAPRPASAFTSRGSSAAPPVPPSAQPVDAAAAPHTSPRDSAQTVDSRQAPAAEAGSIVAWRLLLRDVAITGLPAAKAGREKGLKAWVQLCVKFTALWSHECLVIGHFSPLETEYDWSAETFTLALPNASPLGDGMDQSMPSTEVRVQLCAKISGHPDELVGMDTCTLASRTGRITDMLLRGPIWRGRTASISFSYEIKGLPLAEVEKEWNLDRQSSSSVSFTKLRKPGVGPSGQSVPQLSKKKGIYPFAHFEPAQASKPESPPRPAVRGRKAPSSQLHPSVEESSKRILARPTSAPSARLLLQLDECSRIKQAFKAAGLSCPMSAIEGGLLLPEDRPLMGMSLPRPGSRLIDPFYEPPKPRRKVKRRAKSAKRR
ncbi:hypothetical protein AB1Y20_018899 [Prymnesium parvum]|uniref:Uncharacterized protein n=1 Tax=Prymnesium parvum TaxID=97485 RepID=A0AB34JQT9_PRYPA